MSTKLYVVNEPIMHAGGHRAAGVVIDLTDDEATALGERISPIVPTGTGASTDEDTSDVDTSGDIADDDAMSEPTTSKPNRKK